MLLGIILGVAVAVSVDVANASAERAFQLSTEAVTGRATHTISAGPSGVPESLYADLRSAGLDIPMAPILTQLVTSPELGDQPLQLMGIDPLAEPPFRAYLGQSAQALEAPQNLAAFLVQPGAVFISRELAGQFGLQLGDTLHFEISGRQVEGELAGLIEPQDSTSRQALEGLVLADLSTAQEFSGAFGRLTQIDLILPEDHEDAQLSRLRQLLPEGVVVQPAQGRSNAVQQMTAAFRTNLTALSLLGLVVGLFLIYNTMTFSVLQRRRIFGILRALGATSQEIFALVLGEAVVVGIVGSALGILLGILLGRGAVDLVSRTINDVFFTLTVREVGLPTQSLVRGGLLGIAATLLATIAPAWEAAKSPPRSALSRARLETLSERLVSLAAAGGLLAAVVSGLILAYASLNLTESFFFTFGVVIGAALVAPWVTRTLVAPAGWLLGRWFGPAGRMAPREVSGSASRTSIAMAALMVAVAVAIGVSLMVSSFRGSVKVWLDQILGNDIYVSVAGASLAEPMVAIDPEAIARAEAWPGAAAVHLLRNVQVDSPYGPITVAANNNPNDGNEQVYVEAQGSGDEIWAAVQAGAVMLSEPLANRLSLGVGDSLELYTQQGPHSFPIAAVYRDYTSSQGNVTMWLDVYRALWDDPAVTAFSIEAAPGTDVEAMVAGLRAALSDIQLLHIRSNRSLREETLRVFDRTFTITRALRITTTAVAFVGVLSAMLALQLEKQRQMAILKAIGASARQLWTLILLETGLIGLVAGLLALPTGYAVALILIEIINRRSFGWTMQMQLSPAPFLQALAIALGAALLAGIYPAYRIGRRNTADALRFD